MPAQSLETGYIRLVKRSEGDEELAQFRLPGAAELSRRTSSSC